MNNYLEGYLASIPKNEYNSMVSFLKDNITDKLKISEEQFQQLLSMIVDGKAVSSEETVPLRFERPSDSYNAFFSNAYVDLNYLFKVINLLYNVIDGYSSLSASYLTEIKAEIDKLEIKIREIEAGERYSSNSAIVTETFKNTEFFEDYNSSTRFLFCDRNGEELPIVNLVHNNTNDMIILNTTVDIDLLHGKDGKPQGKIEVLDYRGVPSNPYQVPMNAIDNSVHSFWDTSVHSEEPIDMVSNEYTDSGAYIKFRVNLPSVYGITEVVLTPYCIYPIELCSIQVGNKEILSNSILSIDTIVVRSSRVPSDEITFILHQKNYTHELEVRNEKIEEAMDLLNRAIFPKETNDEIDIYNLYSAKKNNEMTEWNYRTIKQKEMRQ